MMRSLLGFAVAAILMCWSAPAHALLCNFTVGNLVFTDAEVLETGSDAEAEIDIECTGALGTTTRVCISINAGSGGADANGRYMDGPGGKLRYQLYQDATRQVVWGSTSGTLPGDALSIDVGPYPLIGTVNATAKIYGRIFAPQATIVPGNYASAFGTGEVAIAYFTPALLDCATGLGLPPLFATVTFNVSANVVPHCLVDAQNLIFGSHGFLDSAVDADGEVSVTCTPTTTYTVALDGGLSLGAPTARLMKKGPTESITYGLYRDGARTQAWGQTIGSDVVGGTGSGVSQPIPVYGRVPPQPTPSAGTYTDTIVVTVTY